MCFCFVPWPRPLSHNLGREHGSAIFVASNFIVCYCSDVVSAISLTCARFHTHRDLKVGCAVFDGGCANVCCDRYCVTSRDLDRAVSVNFRWTRDFGGLHFFRSKLLLLIHSWCFSCVHVLMNCFCPLGLHEIWSLERRWQRAEGRAKSLGISFGAKAWSSWSWVFDGTSSPNQCFFLDGPPWKEHPPRHTLQMPCY